MEFIDEKIEARLTSTSQFSLHRETNPFLQNNNWDDHD